MKQVIQVLRTGRISVDEVPVPSLLDRHVLVQTRFSVISAGTEKSKVDLGSKSLLGKARARPDLARQVLRKLKTDGIAKTLQTVTARLDAWNPLGYSSAGQVVAVGGDVAGIQPGDWVACAGAGYANHAESAVVPRNLIARIPPAVSAEDAAFCTLGAIALQGVRLADPKLGETVFVLGLGLLGQITVQLLRANGCRVVGTDLDPALCERAASYGATAIPAGGEVIEACRALTGGVGVDAVIICAGTNSNDPIRLAGEISRQKGRVVVVGAVGMDVPREPYFKKEISVVISRSYGPGRYDPAYEESGIDYPVGYVRFTEQRNLESILQLLESRALDFSSLITHRFSLDEANKAYELIEGKKSEPYLGIMLRYAETASAASPARPSPERQSSPVAGEIRIAMCGAGNYATATLLPLLKQTPGVSMSSLLTASGRSAEGVARQFGFARSVGTFEELLESPSDALMIASRHNVHAAQVQAALSAGKHVYVEKPLALTLEQCDQIERQLRDAPGSTLMVGFNRRFAPLVRSCRAHFARVQSPLTVNIRVNAGFLPREHWLNDPAVGGGRLIGEGCHFIDLAGYLVDSLPVSIYAAGAPHAAEGPLTTQNVIIAIRFQNGSIATVTYSGDGSKGLAKERFEMFGGGRSAILDDYRLAELYFEDGSLKRLKASPDKGQSQMLREWTEGLRNGRSPVPAALLLASSRAAIHAVESLMIGVPVEV